MNEKNGDYHLSAPANNKTEIPEIAFPTSLSDDGSAAKPSFPVNCRVCIAPLRSGSNYCTECKSYQNWIGSGLRWGALAGAVLSVSSLIVSASSLVRLTILSPAAVEIAAIRCSESAVVLVVENSGDRSIAIQETTVQSSGFANSIPWKGENLWLETERPEDILIEGNSIKILRLRSVHQPGSEIKIPILQAGRPTNEKCIFTITLTTSSSAGKQNEKVSMDTCKCPAGAAPDAAL